MNTPEVSIVSLDDGQMIELILECQSRLIFIAPGVSVPVAEALAKSWIKIGPEGVSILLDVDPEVCRLGYGSFEGIATLQTTAHQLGTTVNHRPGIRVGIVLTDRTTLVFSPIPLLIEAESTALPRPNAVRLDVLTPDAWPEASTIQKQAQDLIEGSEPVEPGRLEEVAKDLAENPPQKFDLARIVRVFNARFQFVEFELSGLLISRMRVPIPLDLMGLAKDQATQELLQSTFRLVREDSDISGKNILDIKKEIAHRYLTLLKGYGVVCMRVNKEDFLKEVADLRKQIEQFQMQVESQLQAEMNANKERLAEALFPAVYANRPERWTRFIGPQPSKSEVRDCLVNDLNRCFGSARKLISKMKVTVTFKDVTYESLCDPEFVEIAKRAIPSLRILHEEYVAARAQD